MTNNNNDDANNLPPPPPPLEGHPDDNKENDDDDHNGGEDLLAISCRLSNPGDLTESGAFANDEAISAAASRKKQSVELASKETRYVTCLRLLTFGLLALCACAVCLSVYLVSTQSEQDGMEQDFMDLSEKLVLSFETTFQQRFGIVDNFAQELTSYTQDLNSYKAKLKAAQVNNNNNNETTCNTLNEEQAEDVHFPFVTLPDFEKRAGRMAKLADLLCVLLLPKIMDNELEAWHQYANANQGWRAQGIALQQNLPVSEVDVPPIQPQMFQVAANGSTISEDRNGPFYPIWQTFPAVPVNRHTHLNLYRWKPLYQNSMDAVMKYKRPILPTSYDYWNTPKDDLRRTVFNMYVASYQRYSSTVYEDDPCLSFFYPVFDKLDGDKSTKKVETIVLGVIYWRTYFNQILPPGANGIIVVLENRCDQQYTYQVDGSESKFLGHGDLHDTNYDKLVTTIDLTLDADNEEEDIDIDDIEVDCRYRLRVYPSQEFEDSKTTNKPAIYTASLALVFIFTSLAFLLYDYCVERRQRVVMKSAQQSGALVESLFPESVRHRIYEEQEAKNATNGESKKEEWKRRDSAGGGSGGGGGGDLNNTRGASAIANLYPECTVLFADIAGFTKWSSSRTPSQVFELLESIYGEFDKIAQRRRVFKIETIGDCYVATTGIPEPQKDHAVIMCKFARDCRKKLRDLIHSQLLDQLGADTADLAMRFGLHSGPVTAGVLRGAKSRFQIFGDTVNMAARMESNGLREQIQVSEATAALLRKAGKSAWVRPREDKIHAKGKGELQTYWVEIAGYASTEGGQTTKTTCSGNGSDGVAGEEGLDHSNLSV